MGRSKKDPPAPIQLQSAIATPPNTVDEVSGVEAITETDAQGNKRRRIRRLPRSPQDQAFFDKISRMRDNTLTAIEGLSAVDPAQAEAFAPLVASYERLLDTDLRRASGQVRRTLENDLAAAGLSNSSSAAEMRVSLARDEIEARRGIADQARLYGQDLIDRSLGRLMNLYGVADAGLERDEARAQMGANRVTELQQNEIGHMTARTNANNAAILGQYNAQNATRRPSGGAQLGQALTTLGGAFLGGPAGSAIANQFFGQRRYWQNPNNPQ